MDNPLHAASLIGSHWNHKAAVSDSDDLILKLILVFRTTQHRFELARHSASSRLDGAADTGEFGAVALVHFTVVNGLPQPLCEVAKIRQSGSLSGEIRIGLRFVLPPDAKPFDLAEENLDALDLLNLKSGTLDGKLLDRWSE
jgi:hypothetical protein